MAHAAMAAEAATVHTAMAQARLVQTRALVQATTKSAWPRAHSTSTVAPFACYTFESF